MRIIGGNLKGKKINFFKSQTTRPLKDSVKESIFNILNHSNNIEVEIKNSKVLDLYAGTGSFGIECISRGAKKVTYVEQDLTATNVLKENLNKLSISNKSIVYNFTIESFLMSQIKEKFDMFFLDPPFANNFFLKNLKVIKNKKLFSKKHLVIIHREEKSKDDFEEILELIEIKKYGRSKIIFSKFK